MNREFIISEIVKYCQKLDHKGFGANHDGNISAKYDNTLLATPTAVSKGNIDAAAIITLDNNGKQIAGAGKPFSEIKIHVLAYSARPEIGAVIHAHPPFATARGLVNLPLQPTIPEAVISIGNIVPVVEFSMPGDKKTDNIVTAALAAVDVFMMPGNGVFAVGSCVEQAYLRLELVEHLAKIDYYATHMGVPLLLTTEEIAQLMAKRTALGLGPKKNGAANPTYFAKNNQEQLNIGNDSSTNQEINLSSRQKQLAEIKKIILEEIKKATK